MDNLGDSRTDYTKSKSIKRITRADKKKMDHGVYSLIQVWFHNV